jgi:hypothetical protein
MHHLHIEHAFGIQYQELWEKRITEVKEVTRTIWKWLYLQHLPDLTFLAANINSLVTLYKLLKHYCYNLQIFMFSVVNNKHSCNLY